MQKNFIECKEGKAVAERGHEEQPLGRGGGVSICQACKGTEGGKQVPLGLVLVDADGKGRRDRKEWNKTTENQGRKSNVPKIHHQ